ncbi:M24 family metallopeptidase [Sinomonas terrae]|uniref:Peptidase M24 n=1 Tax=Sinomonas terrae TaxID=2908838 RepID=A0ABS9TY47_9MICC|nr:peptidase M24 [Sinomonas terrae]MCH6469092.1 peptidase M24 [Sinomonas terrae]
MTSNVRLSPAEAPGATSEEHADEHAEKRLRVLALLDAEGFDAVALTSPAALAWYLEGARTHVSLAAPPIVAAVVSRGEDRVHVTSNEAHRLVGEELPAWAHIVEHPWHASVVAAAEADARDAGGGPESRLEDGLRAARQELLPPEVGRFRELGHDVARLLTQTLAKASPEDTERALAARLTAGIVELGAEPVVVLAGGESRRMARHPLPTSAPLGNRAMVVVCARRHGLILNASRWIRFGERPASELDADLRILRVEAAYLEASRPGSSLAKAFASGIAAYAENGFSPDEWTRHHQGGVAGYAGRDPRSAPGIDPALGTDVRLGTNVAFAWNPTALGCKVEDTILSGASGFEVLSLDPEWPTVAVDVAGQRLDRPDVLEL